MLKSLTLHHFKSFRESATIPLAPLTLIYGGNSGGKSTIIQAMMLLKQTLDSTAAPDSPLIFGSDTYLDLGNYWGVTPYVGGGLGFNADIITGNVAYTRNDTGAAYSANLTPGSTYC